MNNDIGRMIEDHAVAFADIMIQCKCGYGDYPGQAKSGMGKLFQGIERKVINI